MMLDGSYGDDQLEKNLGNKRLNDFTFASLSQNNRDMIRDHITESDTTNNMVKDETITKDMIEEEAKAYMNKEIKFDPQSRLENEIDPFINLSEQDSERKEGQLVTENNEDNSSPSAKYSNNDDEESTISLKQNSGTCEWAQWGTYTHCGNEIVKGECKKLRVRAPNNKDHCTSYNIEVKECDCDEKGNDDKNKKTDEYMVDLEADKDEESREDEGEAEQNSVTDKYEYLKNFAEAGEYQDKEEKNENGVEIKNTDKQNDNVVTDAPMFDTTAEENADILNKDKEGNKKNTEVIDNEDMETTDSVQNEEKYQADESSKSSKELEDEKNGEQIESDNPKEDTSNDSTPQTNPDVNEINNDSNEEKVDKEEDENENDSISETKNIEVENEDDETNKNDKDNVSDTTEDKPDSKETKEGNEENEPDDEDNKDESKVAEIEKTEKNSKEDSDVTVSKETKNEDDPEKSESKEIENDKNTKSDVNSKENSSELPAEENDGTKYNNDSNENNDSNAHEEGTDYQNSLEKVMEDNKGKVDANIKSRINPARNEIHKIEYDETIRARGMKDNDVMDEMISDDEEYTIAEEKETKSNGDSSIKDMGEWQNARH